MHYVMHVSNRKHQRNGACNMASVHRQPKRPYWYGAYTTSDGQRHFKSTKTKDKQQALEVVRAWEQAVRQAKARLLTAENARDVIAKGVEDAFMAANAGAMPRTTIGSWVDDWLAAVELERGDAARERYRIVADRFKKHLGAKCQRDLAVLAVDDVERFRDSEAKTRSKSTANLSLKIVRACLSAACRKQLITTNVARLVPILTRHTRDDNGARRAFTETEIARILKVAKGTEFYGLILMGLNTAQRLGDLAALRWSDVDLTKRLVRFTQKKTGNTVEIPLADVTVDYLLTLPSTDNPKAHVFPKSAETASERTGPLSRQFYEKVLVKAKLAEERKHVKKAKGRTGTRQVSELSFHSLRHSVVTLAKATGATDAQARGLAGHESAAVNAHYTKMTADQLRPVVGGVMDELKKGGAL
jgi:integrase